MIASPPSHALAQDAADDAEVMAVYRAYSQAAENGNERDARRLAKEAYELAEEKWGATRKETALLATNYADALTDNERWRPALRVYERCVEILQNIEDALNEDAYCRLGAANASLMRGDDEKAKTLYWSAIELLDENAETDQEAARLVGEAYLRLAMISDQRTAPPAPRGTIFSGDTASRIQSQTPERRYDATGRELALQSLKLFKIAFDQDQIIVAQAHRVAGNYAEVEEDFEAAEAHYQAAFDILQNLRGPDHPETIAMDGRVAFAQRYTRDKPFEPEPVRQPSSDKCRVSVRGDLEIEYCPEKRYPPYFPNQAYYKDQQGFSIVRFDITETGETANAKIVHSWPGGIFDERSLEAVARWKYFPPTDQYGNTVSVSGVEVQVTYVIRG